MNALVTNIFYMFPIEFEAILYYLLLIDALAVNLVMWFGAKWYSKTFQSFSRYFSSAKGWALYYLILILWVGSLMYRFGMLF